MIQDGEICTNGKLFEEKIEVSRIGAEKAVQGRSNDQIGLDYSEHIREYQNI